jgi:ribA/ribD-fused uncharacterized protein
MDVFDKLPKVLTPELLEYFAQSHDDLNKTPWSEVIKKLTKEQFTQAFDYIGAKKKRIYETIPQAERDAHYRGGALHFMADHNYVSLFDEYNYFRGYQDSKPDKDGGIYPAIIRFYSSTYLEKQEQFTFFSEKKSPFAICYPCPLEIDGMVFNSASQYLAYAKAEQFRDRERMKLILETQDISQYQQISRQVRYYYRGVYAMMVGEWMRKVLKAKFTQHPELQKALFATAGTSFAVATQDTRWGIGLILSPKKTLPRTAWKGKNLLGELLTELRVKLMEKY